MKRNKYLLNMTINLLYYRSAQANMITFMHQQAPKDLTNVQLFLKTLTAQYLHFFPLTPRKS